MLVITIKSCPKPQVYLLQVDLFTGTHFDVQTGATHCPFQVLLIPVECCCDKLLLKISAECIKSSEGLIWKEFELFEEANIFTWLVR